MTTETLTLTDFLLARIAEDEAVAQAATPGPWEWKPERDTGVDQGPWLETVARAGPVYSDGAQAAEHTILSGWGHDWCGLNVEPGDAEHIARHDPARVLAECEAKRRLVEQAESVEGSIEGEWGYTYSENPGWLILAHLASVYADHPDYREDWRP